MLTDVVKVCPVKGERQGQMRHFSLRENTYFRQFMKMQALVLIGVYNYHSIGMSATASPSGCSGKMVLHNLFIVIVVLSYLRSSAHMGNPRHYNT